MLRFILLFQLVAMLSCVTNSSTPVSSRLWGQSSAQDMECQLWPEQDNILRVKRILSLQGISDNQIALAADVVLRSGDDAIVYGRFPADFELNDKSFAVQKFGLGGEIVGGGRLGNLDYVIILQKDKGYYWLELRKMPQNIVVFKTARQKGRLLFAQAYLKKDGFWFAYKQAKYSHSVAEDTGLRIMYISLAQEPKKQVPQILFDKKFPPHARLIDPIDNEQAFVVWLDEDYQNPKQSQFWLMRLSTKKGVQSLQKKLPFKIDLGIESWDAAAIKDVLLFLVVDGDSLVGTAKAKIVRVNWKYDYLTAQTIKTRSLAGLHVSEPFVFRYDQQRVVAVLPAWLDQETRLMTFHWEARSNEIKEHLQGNFTKGASIESSFLTGRERQAYLWVRTRHDQKWQFHSCKLSM